MTLLLFIAFLLALCALVAYGVSDASLRKQKVRPPPRSKKQQLTYQDTNNIAGLFLAATSLDERNENWTTVFKVLNPEDNPQIRTLLLELRQANTSSPRAVLTEIKAVCMEAKRKGGNPTRSQLLDEALTHLREASP